MRRPRTVVGIALVLSAALTTMMCDSPRPAGETVGEMTVGTHFAGRLVDTNQLPVSGARLYVFAALGGKGASHAGQMPLSREMTRTDANGAFEFNQINQGMYSLQFYWQQQNRKGNLYLDAQEFWVIVDPDETTADVTIVIPALGDKAVEGHVRDGQGRGIAGVDVSAMGWRDYSRSSTKTDDSGHYRIEGIAGNIAETVWFRHARYSDAELKSISVGSTNADVVMSPK
jgi:hypothetical protein